MSVKQFSEDFLSHYYWQNAGVITSEYSGDDAAPLPTELDYDTIDELDSTKKIIIEPPNGVVAIELRFRSDGSENDANVAPLYAVAGRDHYRLVDTLTVTQGTQIYSTGIYFADTVAAAGETWLSTTKEPSPADSMASYVLNVHGYDRFLLVASDLVTTSLYVDWRRF